MVPVIINTRNSHHRSDKYRWKNNAKFRNMPSSIKTPNFPWQVPWQETKPCKWPYIWTDSLLESIEQSTVGHIRFEVNENVDEAWILYTKRSWSGKFIGLEKKLIKRREVTTKLIGADSIVKVYNLLIRACTQEKIWLDTNPMKFHAKTNWY